MACFLAMQHLALDLLLPGVVESRRGQAHSGQFDLGLKGCRYQLTGKILYVCTLCPHYTWQTGSGTCQKGWRMLSLLCLPLRWANQEGWQQVKGLFSLTTDVSEKDAARKQKRCSVATGTTRRWLGGQSHFYPPYAF